MGKGNLYSIESFLRRRIFPDLKRGRKDWDEQHTKAVVKKIKLIIKITPNLKVSPEVLIIAAYLHDWGYSRLHGEADDKQAHMKISASLTKELLRGKNFKFLINMQKARIVHLVGVHDNLNLLKDTDELILMEADTLGALDVGLVKPTFTSMENAAYIKNINLYRYPLFITDIGRLEYVNLLKKRQRYYVLHSADQV